MLCKVADLLVEIPEAGGMSSRCRDYQLTADMPADITIDQKKYHYDRIPEDPELVAYLDSGTQFYYQLLKHDGMVLHASAVEIDNRAYLFSGPCGTGKSTHTKLWQSVFGKDAKVFNDDKPALRCIDGVWYAYGTPWCGKDGINQNMKVPLAGICFLTQSKNNEIRHISKKEAVKHIIYQTIHHFNSEKGLDYLIKLVDRIVNEIPIFEFENRPEPEAAILSYETMRKAAQEVGL